MEWVIATFHLRRSKIMARYTQEGWHYDDSQLPSYSMVPLRRPHSCSSGRERANGCQSASLEVTSRARLEAQLQ